MSSRSTATDTAAPAPQENAPEQQAAAPVEQPAGRAGPDQTAAAPSADEAADENSQMAALPHSGEVTFAEPGCAALAEAPPQCKQPDAPCRAEGPERARRRGGLRPDGMRRAKPSTPMAALPGEDADPNAYPAGPEDEPQEWVQVLVSGAGMHGAASEDAPALFAFPYGRALAGRVAL